MCCSGLPAVAILDKFIWFPGTGFFHSPIVSTQNRRPQQVFHLFSRICPPPCGPILAPCVRKSGKMLPAAATGATLSTFSAPIRRKYGGSSRWESGKDFFL